MIENRSDGDKGAALASRVRRDVLEFLLAADAPVNASQVATQIGLHVTTARFHLEQLENAKLIRRQVGREGRRGRPPVTYVAGPRARERDANHQLALVLADALAGDPDGGKARGIDAGRQWGEATISELGDGNGNLEEQLIRVLDRLGFDPQAGTVAVDGSVAIDGSDAVVKLLSCPFRDIASKHRDVVCSIHLGLLHGAANRLGRSSSDVGLVPFAEPELCLVTVRGAAERSSPQPLAAEPA